MGNNYSNVTPNHNVRKFNIQQQKEQNQKNKEYKKRLEEENIQRVVADIIDSYNSGDSRTSCSTNNLKEGKIACNKIKEILGDELESCMEKSSLKDYEYYIVCHFRE